MSSRIRKAKGTTKKPERGKRALSKVRRMISRNRLTLARIDRMPLEQMVTLATVLVAAHNASNDPDEKENLKTLVAYIHQKATANYGNQ